MRPNRPSRQPLLCIAAALLMTSGFTQPTMAAPDPVSIPVVLSLTGNGAFIGRNEQISLRAAEDAINKAGGIDGRPIAFAVTDDQSTPQVAVQLLNAALAQKPNLVMGSSIAADCGPMAPLVKNGPVLYCESSATDTVPGSYMFATLFASHEQYTATMRYFRARGIKRLALLTSTDRSGQDGETQVLSLLATPEFSSMTTVAREHFGLGDLSIAAQLARIKAANADLLVAIAIGPAAGSMFKAISDAGLHVPVLTSSGNMIYDQLKAQSANLPDELYFPTGLLNAPDSVHDPATVRALSLFRSQLAAHGTRPELIHVGIWDNAMLIADALRNLGPDVDAERLRAYLSNDTSFTGAAGRYDFKANPQRGLGVANIVVVKWDKPRTDWVAVSKPGGAPL